MQSKPHPEDVAQICRGGHVIVTSLKVSPNLRKSFCERCGSATVTQCQTCGWPIAGEGYAPFGGGGPYELPKYCAECGKPYPWTERALSAAKEYTDDLDRLSAEEKTTLKASFDDLTGDTARTPVAAERFKKLLSKIGPAAGDTLKQIIVSVASEAAKRSMGL
jgi:hypothetical protein